MTISVVITGMPASGKTTVGRAVAKRLDLEFHDADSMVETVAGKPIREIFTDDGEAAFRALEEAVVVDTLRTRSGVLALGGGAVLSEAIRDALAGFTVVWLDVSVAVATRRAGMNKLRPLLLGDVRARMEELMSQRRPLYEQVATFRVSTNRESTAAVTERVLHLLTTQAATS